MLYFRPNIPLLSYFISKNVMAEYNRYLWVDESKIEEIWSWIRCYTQNYFFEFTYNVLWNVCSSCICVCEHMHTWAHVCVCVCVSITLEFMRKLKILHKKISYSSGSTRTYHIVIIFRNRLYKNLKNQTWLKSKEKCILNQMVGGKTKDTH